MNNSRTYVPDRTPTQTGDDSRSFRLDSERGASPSGYLLKRLLASVLGDLLLDGGADEPRQPA